MPGNDCPICGEEVTESPYKGGNHNLDCIRCGQFSINTIAWSELCSNKTLNRANISGWIREHQGFEITTKDLGPFSQLHSPSVGEKGEKLLRWFAKTNPKAGNRISLIVQSFKGNVSGRLSGLNPSTAQTLLRRELLAHCWAEDFQEFFYILEDFLEKEMGFIECDSSGYRITPSGWGNLQRTNVESHVGFIAMWFAASMNEAWKAIEQGIRAAGYDARRIDQKEHNNEISDEIIAEIRKSKFLIADLTDHRNGVYFEAGFAKGLGHEVIWLCRRDELGKAHFDTRQYNFIVWEPDNLDELTKRLKVRIEATIGPGPLPESHQL